MIALAKHAEPRRKYTTRKAVYDEKEREEIVRLYVDNLWSIAHLPPDMLTVISSIYMAIKAGHLLVVEYAGRIVGCTAYSIGRVWFHPEELAFDMGFFVIPEFRKSRASWLLLDALKKEVHPRDLIMGASTTDESVAPIMAKRYPQVTAAFLVKT